MCYGYISLVAVEVIQNDNGCFLTGTGGATGRSGPGL